MRQPPGTRGSGRAPGRLGTRRVVQSRPGTVRLPRPEMTPRRSGRGRLPPAICMRKGDYHHQRQHRARCSFSYPATAACGAAGFAVGGPPAWAPARTRPAGPMRADRAALLWGLVAEQAAWRRGGVAAVDVCAAALAALPVSGAWVMAQGAAAGHLMCVTDEVCEQLAELQMTLGEGPCLDVLASGSPVLVADLDDSHASRRWPGFTPQARQASAAAIFALPLQIGAIQVGSLGLYRDKPGPLGTGSLGDALILADAATVILLENQHT